MVTGKQRLALALVMVVLISCGLLAQSAQDDRLEKKTTFEIRHWTQSVVSAPDAKTGSFDLILRDTEERKEQANRILGKEYPPCAGIALSRDGKRLASVHYDSGLIVARHAICLWDVSSGREMRKVATLFFEKEQCNEQPECLHYLTFSWDGRSLATRHSDDSTVVWDTATATKRLRLETKGLAVGFTRDGRHLITATRTGLVQHWDLTTGKGTDRRAGPKDDHYVYVNAAVASADGSTLALTDGHTVVVKDARTGKRLRHYGDLGSVDSLALSTDGKSVVAEKGFDPEWERQRLGLPDRPEARRESPTVSLEGTVVSRKETYALDLGGKTVAEYARHFMVGNDLPPSPAVDLVFTIRNTSATPIVIEPEGTFFSYLVGDGAVNHPGLPYQIGFSGNRPPPVKVSLSPGETYSIPLKSLTHDYHQGSFWLLPGEYTLHVSYLMRADPAPNGWETSLGDGSGLGCLRAAPLKLKVVE